MIKTVIMTMMLRTLCTHPTDTRSPTSDVATTRKPNPNLEDSRSPLLLATGEDPTTKMSGPRVRIPSLKMGYQQDVGFANP